MGRAARELESAYGSLERELSVEPGERYAKLVVANGNHAVAVHRWFRLKESFSASLLDSVLADTGLAGRADLALLDPYLGGGTSVISALQANAMGKTTFARVVGIERNPFLHLVARTKVRAYVEEAPDFQVALKQLRRLKAAGQLEPAPVPSLSTFANADFFPTRVLNDLLRLHTGIESLPTPSLTRDLLRVCLGGSVEPVSGLRRDGRTLRRADKPVSATVMREFTARTQAVAEDLSKIAIMREVDTQVHLGDGRAVASTVDPKGGFDLALFSPPYANNIDYTEVYKLENWLLGLIGNRAEFRAQRLLTMRSHPSIRFPDAYETSDNGYRETVAPLLAPLLEAIPVDRYRYERERTIRGYFDDMLQTLVGVHRVLKTGGHAVYVVGNSAHGHGDDGFVIASDLVIAALASAVGFDVARIAVARHPSRRSVPSRFLRESVVFLTKR
jgi:hypothetical protein